MYLFTLGELHGLLEKFCGNIASYLSIHFQSEVEPSSTHSLYKNIV